MNNLDCKFMKLVQQNPNLGSQKGENLTWINNVGHAGAWDGRKDRLRAPTWVSQTTEASIC